MGDANRKRMQAENAIKLHSFNSRGNMQGERYRVCVAEAEEYSEGVSFMHVRRVIVDQGFGFHTSWSMIQQRIGRAIRSCSHEGLPLRLRNLQIDMFVLVHSQSRYPPTLDYQKFVYLEQEMISLQQGMEFLRRWSVDYGYY